MDISAAKGISLETTTKALEKAYGGNMTALAKLSPELRDMIKGGATLDEVMQAMAKTFGGAASDAADTTAGKFKLMRVSLDETKESIGASLLPVVEAVLPYLQGMADWASKNPGVFTVIAGTIGAVAGGLLGSTLGSNRNDQLAGTVIGALVGGAIGNEVGREPTRIEQRQVCRYIPVQIQQGEIVTFSYRGRVFTQTFNN
jgi:uncharacterized membrane protein YeaQ/YmgE (transglycosylase-associated protein family)